MKISKMPLPAINLELPLHRMASYAAADNYEKPT